MVRSQASMSSSWRRYDPPETPALLTSTSSCPKSATAPPTRAATWLESATSHDLKDALPPALRISSTVRCPPSTFVSPMATVAPAAAMSRAMARPIPVAPPVRSTTRSFREGISPSLLVLFVNSPRCQCRTSKTTRGTTLLAGQVTHIQSVPRTRPARARAGIAAKSAQSMWMWMCAPWSARASPTRPQIGTPGGGRKPSSPRPPPRCSQVAPTWPAGWSSSRPGSRERT